MDTTKLDDLLNQAEAQEAEQGEWIEDINYTTKNFYVDEHGVVEIKNKTIGDMSKHISVKGESYSQYIEFKIGRFFDGIDLTKMQLAIYFNIPNVGGDESRPINVYYNENEIKFGWVIPPEVAQVNLTIEFCIYARGILSDGNNYVLKTKTAKYSINDGLDIGSGIIEPTNNWYLNFVLEMDEKVAQASENADRAEQAASSLNGVVETVTTARDEVVQKASTVDTQHSEVESWHQESEQFRNEAEQFRNQAEAITGIGLAEEGKPGLVQPDGVTTKVDENGNLIVIGGGSGGGGTTDYQALENKPSIAGVELNGDKSYDDLGLASKDEVERNFETVNQNFQTLGEFAQALDRDISALDTELEATNENLNSTTDKVDNLTERTESGFKVEVVGKDIHLTDAVDGKVVDFAMYGKSEQNTTSGSNLVDIKEPITGYKTPKPIEAGTYTLSFKTTATQGGFRMSNTTDTSINSISGLGDKNADGYVVITLITTFVTNYINLSSEGGVISDVMLNAGATALPFEPYTGGIPSPNPDYPQEIETAGASGSIEVTSTNEDASKSTTSLIPTPNGLPGIKVPSGGNYTDENGQQWITDEIVRYADGSGEYVQRIASVDMGILTWGSGDYFSCKNLIGMIKEPNSSFDYSHALSTCFIVNTYDYMRTNDNTLSVIWKDSSSHGQIWVKANTITDLEAFLEKVSGQYLYYELANQTRTPLTAEQISEIDKLNTFKPITNISNNEQCGMKITYATLQEALMLQEALNGSKANTQEIVDIKKELSDTTFKVETIIEKADLGIKETASGEEIHLTDSAEGKAVEFALFGKAKQQSTSGKNLLQSKMNTTTIKGVTCTKNEDGTYTFNGTARDDADFYIDGEYGSPNNIFEVDSTKTYAIKGTKTNLIGLYTGGFGNKTDGSNFVATNQTSIKYFMYRVSKGVTVSNYTVYPQIEVGNVSTDFEPFTNGASPNPQYPQPIEVSGESYNLLENTATSQTINGVEFVVNEDKSVEVVGVSTSSYVNFDVGTLNVKAGESYTFSGIDGGSESSYRLYIMTNAKTFGNDFAMYSGEVTKTATVDDVATVRFQVIPSGYNSDTIIYPMIRKASVKNDRYMPYGKGSVEVKSYGKNLAKLEQGTLAYDTTGAEVDSTTRLRTNFIPIIPNTYYIATNDGLVIKNGCMYDENKKYLGYGAFPDVLTNILNVQNNNARYVRFIYGASDNREINPSEFNYQLELGNVATEYQPHKETLSTIPTDGLAGIPVSSGGNYTDQNGQQWICDVIVKYADGSGEYVKRFGKEIFDGSEDEGWAIQKTVDNEKYRVRTKILSGLIKAPLSNSITFVGLATVEKSVPAGANGTYDCVNGISVNALGSELHVYSDSYNTSDVTLWTDYLAENPMTLYYELATPITTPLTAEELAEISTFYPVTNISNDFDCGMKIEYVGDSIITTNTEIPIVIQDGEPESGDNIVTILGKITNKLNNISGSNVQEQLTNIITRLSALEQNQKTIVYSDTEPETVEENTIVMVYETEE